MAPPPGPDRRGLLGRLLAPRPAPALTEARAIAVRAGQLWGAVAALALAAVAFRLWVTVLVQPYAWTLPAWLALPVLTLATAAAAAAPVLLLARLIRAQSPPRGLLAAPEVRPRWWLRGRGFPVAPTPWLGVPLLLYLSWATGTLPLTMHADGRLAAGPAALLAGLTLVQPPLAAVAWYVARGPQLALTPQGVLLRGARSGPQGRLVPWADVDLSGVAGPRRRALPLAPGVEVPLSWLWVDPLFLARAVRHYAAHPEHRAAIGTPLELIRLRAALAAADDRPAARIPRQREAAGEHDRLAG
ncbi:hypothetical protein GCM10010124_23960 [Pilimelia terevasa]|uniref:Uncharacterized protein n=2 Tax=Pilimelia terevasa TaxID=53372 RepID=A0A8J3FJS9_9ACTN|nr:hypothetical protein GCM10010124_23960 [Pilimelia terevasa]